MKIKHIKREKLKEDTDFYDISTNTGNFVIWNTKCVVHNSHISVLLITAFLRMFPEIIKKGMVYLAIMPLYGVRNFNSKFLPFYSEDEMIKFKNEHPNIEISRYK